MFFYFLLINILTVVNISSVILFKAEDLRILEFPQTVIKNEYDAPKHAGRFAKEVADGE